MEDKLDKKDYIKRIGVYVFQSNKLVLSFLPFFSQYLTGFVFLPYVKLQCFIQLKKYPCVSSDQIIKVIYLS